MRYWVYKCNSRGERVGNNNWGDWRSIFQDDKPSGWGFMNDIPGLDQLREGDRVIAHQTDRHELVGVLKVVGFKRGELILSPCARLHVDMRALKRDFMDVGRIPAYQGGPIRSIYEITRADAELLLRRARKEAVARRGKTSSASVIAPASAVGKVHPQELDTSARWDALFPASHRQAVARSLSRSILAAHAIQDTGWTVTLSSYFVRLNVGMPQALTLSTRDCNLIVMDDASVLRDLARAGLRVRRQQEFGSAPGTVSIVFPLASLAQVHAHVWRSHLQGMEIAATKRPVTPHRGYSHELVSHLRVMGFDVPDSNCPEAVALRAGRSREATTRGLDQGRAAVEPFLPGNIEDARRYVQASIMRRQGQGEFRDAVLRAYGFACAITGCEVLDVLEAAHIVPYRGDVTNHVQNGVLLRADLHVLFDVGLLGFDARWRVRVDGSLRSTGYGELDGKALRMPKGKSARPSREALAHRKKGYA